MDKLYPEIAAQVAAAKRREREEGVTNTTRAEIKRQWHQQVPDVSRRREIARREGQ